MTDPTNSDPVCWHADDFPDGPAYRMIASASTAGLLGLEPRVGMKIMGDTLTTTPEHARAFAAALVRAAAEAEAADVGHD